jgi:glycosyltransferase involved in cell wall biosynthesis
MQWLAYCQFGWEMLEQLREVGFGDVAVYHYRSREFGYLGKEQAVFIARKGVSNVQVGVDTNVKISAIICTHNRSDLLPKAIGSLISQTITASNYEIIVVDNASTDNTKLVCEGFLSLPNFRYIYESVSGLSVARNRGLVEAQGKYVAYIDDDAIASPHWLELLVQAFETVHPAPVSVGGKIYPIWEVEKPGWFPDEKKPYLTILDYGDEPLFITYPRILYGTNMAFVREALLAINSFRTDVGRCKGNLLSCEESDIFSKFARKRLPVYYLPEASVEHLASKERLIKKWLYRRHYWQGRSEILLLPEGMKKTALIGFIVGCFSNILVGLRNLSNSKMATATCNNISLIYTSVGRIQQLTQLLFKGKRSEKKGILVIARTLPRFDRGSGHLRLFSIIQTLISKYHVTYVAENYTVSDECDDTLYIDRLESMGIEIHADDIDWDMVLNKSYETIIFEFYDTAIRHLSSVRRALPFAFAVIDSVDVHFAREAQMATVHKDATLLEAAELTKHNELEVYQQADLIWAVTESDKRILLDENPRMNIDVVPNIHKAVLIRRDNIQRNTLLFVGNFWHQPNEDAAIYFCTEVFPEISRMIPDAVFLIVGNAPTESVKALATESIKVIGWVPDMTQYLESCHISVVPLRYGAGMKGKVGEAMGAGMPVVTTSIGIQGMDVVPGNDLLVADDPNKFAKAVVRLLSDENLARTLSVNATEYINRRFTPEIVGNAVMKSLREAENDKIERFVLRRLRSFLSPKTGIVKQEIPYLQCQINANLEEKVIFLGYEIADGTVKPGDSFTITYYWQCIGTIRKDYSAFVHFTSNGKIMFQNDHSLSCSQWKKGQVSRDVQRVTVPLTINENISICLGLWSPKDNHKLQVVNPGSANIDKDRRLFVGTLEITYD